MYNLLLNSHTKNFAVSLFYTFAESKIIEMRIVLIMSLMALMQLNLTACSSSKSSKGSNLTATVGNNELQGKRWELLSLQGNPIPTTLSKAFIYFGKDGACNGNGSCNSFSGSYTVTGMKLKLGQMASTERLCHEMATEDSFYGLMPKIDSYKIKNGQLYLLQGEKIIAQFKEVATP